MAQAKIRLFRSEHFWQNFREDGLNLPSPGTLIVARLTYYDGSSTVTKPPEKVAVPLAWTVLKDTRYPFGIPKSP